MGDTDHRGLTAAVADVLDRHVPADATVVLGVSGGPDSVALLHLVAGARPDLRLVVGHVRHGLRDDAVDAEAAAANAAVLGAGMVVLSVAVGEGEGPEDAARIARHTALLGLARERGAAALLLGHTADDQAETVLLRLARGTGIDGLAGMRPATERDGIPILRPLLGLRRADVHAVSDAHPTAVDPSNTDDPDQRRGRVRRDALPALARLRPDQGDPVPALARLADLAAADAALLDAVAVTPGTVSRYGTAVVVHMDATMHLGTPHRDGSVPTGTALDGTALDGTALDERVHEAVRRRRVRAGWRMLPGGHRLSPDADSIERILGLTAGERIDVSGGVRATGADGFRVLLDPAVPTWDAQPLPLREVVSLPDLGIACVVHAGVAGTAVPEGHPMGPPPWTAEVAMPPSGPGGIVVRPRAAAGDRHLRKVLQRTPAALRDQVPIVVAADGTVLMVGDRTMAPAVPGQPCLRISVAADGSGSTGYRGGP